MNPRHPGKTLTTGLLCFSFLIAPAAVGAQYFPVDEDLELMLRFIVEDLGTPGLALGVLEADETTRTVSYGSGGGDSRVLGPRSVFEIGSVTKTFTATLLADMVLKGEVELDDPVARYLPDHVTVPSYEGREITLLDLATHTSALPSAPVDVNSMRSRSPLGGDGEFTVEDAYAFLSEYRLPREPGARFNYSNFGYALLSHALGRAAGSSFRELVQSRILDPLGMQRTGFAMEGELAEWMTRGHRGVGEAAYRTDQLEFFDGSGGLRSNVEDLLKYMHAHVAPPTTDLERAMRMAREIRISTDGRGSGHGLAWHTSASPRGEPVVGHTGGTLGYSAHFFFMPESGRGVVLLANQRPFEDELASSLLMPDPPPPEWTPVPVAAEVLTRYAGSYALPGQAPGYFLRLEEEGYLTYQPRDRARARLYATCDSTFYLLRGPWSFTFRPIDDLEAVEMIMEVDERGTGATGRRVAQRVGPGTLSSAVVAGRPDPPTRIPWVWFGLFAAIVTIAGTRPLWST